jgi:hypothetical protein
VKRGTIRADGYFFNCYDRNADGTLRAKYLSPVAWHRSNIGNALRHAETRAAAASLPCDINIDYLQRIFPKDGRCPVLLIPLVWGFGNDSSPSLDRTIPNLGYVRGNVAFISGRANRIKSDATTEELFAVAKYLKDMDFS